ncbi:MAG: hypothetical protein IT384_34325 [Deltaproteobacteria bacterium]|nr:hypothetical protein [Deltaproteobacteria bacterium]
MTAIFKGATAIAVLVPAVALANEPAIRAHLDWAQLAASGALLGGRVLPTTGDTPSQLRVESSTGTRIVPLAVLEHPPVHSGFYALRGELTAKDVEGVAYLELWSAFPGQGRFFSRTLADAGAMRSIRGSEGPRPFLVPFDAQKAMSPERLELNLFLPGKGTVTLGPVELVELETSEALWSLVQGSLTVPWTLSVGPVLGALLGLLGAAIGVLSGLGRGRRVVRALMTGGTLVSVLCALGGMVMLSRGATWVQASGLLFVGLLGSVLLIGLRGTVERRYELGQTKETSQ